MGDISTTTKINGLGYVKKYVLNVILYFSQEIIHRTEKGLCSVRNLVLQNNPNQIVKEKNIGTGRVGGLLMDMDISRYSQKDIPAHTEDMFLSMFFSWKRNLVAFFCRERISTISMGKETIIV